MCAQYYTHSRRCVRPPQKETYVCVVQEVDDTVLTQTAEPDSMVHGYLRHGDVVKVTDVSVLPR